MAQPSGKGICLPAHDAAILAEVRAGSYSCTWLPLELSRGITIEVMADALMVHAYRPSTTPACAQLIADELGACLLTPWLADLLWCRADVRIAPQTQPVRLDGHGHAMPEPHRCPGCDALDHGPWELCQACGEREHSLAIDEAIADELHGAPLAEAMVIGNTGKPWVLSKSCFAKPGMIGQPYGWHVRAGHSHAVTPGLSVVQPCRHGGLPAPHGALQLDYSEPVRLWRWPWGDVRELVCGSRHKLVSHEGPLPDWRLPGVPQ